MAENLRETGLDHRGNRLPRGIFAQVRADDSIAAYKIRWRADGADGVRRNASKSFSVRKLGSADRALASAMLHREEAVGGGGAAVEARPQPEERMTVEDLFQEWCVKHAAGLSRSYGEKAVRMWDAEIASRSIAKVRLERLSADPAILVRFQDSLAAEGVGASKRVELLKLLRSVLRWGRRRHPNALRMDLGGLFEMPRRGPSRLAYAADAYGLERIIEAVLGREARDDLLPLRDAAFVAAMGFTVAARPSEWLYSACWGDVGRESVELQRPSGRAGERRGPGLKTGARAALLLPNARQRLADYRRALEERFGPQPDQALVFQLLGEDGPQWSESGSGRTPVAWSANDYKRWTARVWRPARAQAARAEGAPRGLEAMRFYDCRHTAISLALHSTLVMGPHGMNLHSLAGWAGHDVATLQRYYSHLIARHQGGEPIDLAAECAEARRQVEAQPFSPAPQAGPQRGAQRRRRARAAAAPRARP